MYIIAEKTQKSNACARDVRVYYVNRTHGKTPGFYAGVGPTSGCAGDQLIMMLMTSSLMSSHEVVPSSEKVRLVPLMSAKLTP